MPQSAPSDKAAGAPVTGFVRTWATIGVLSFGGPAGQIATMHRELVEKRQWIDDATFLRALNFCMLLPGPEAQQLATWCGWRLRGTRGGLIAGLLFIAPGAAVMTCLTMLYVAYGQLGIVKAVFAGVQAAVVAVVVQALLKVASRALKSRFDWLLAAAAFVLIAVFAVPFQIVIALAAMAGWLHGRGTATGAPAIPLVPASWTTSLRTALLWLVIWMAPLALAAATLGPDHPLVDLGSFFARLAAFSFGGAYAGLAYVAQGAAAGHGWVTPVEIVDGLALAETTPGPLVLVYQFVGGLAGHRIAGPWPAVLGGLTGMAMVVWMTFTPSFLFIFTLAPQLERLTARPGLAKALAGVTAAVVGVIASLGVWFALHVLFARVDLTRAGPVQLWTPAGPPNLYAAITGLLALLLLFRTRLGMLPVLGLAGGAGLLRWWMGGT